MLQRSADLKGFVQDLGSHESYLTESEWAEFKMMVEVNWRSWTTIWLLLLAPAITPRVFIAARGFLGSCLGEL